MKNFSFLLLQNMVPSYAKASDGHSETIFRLAQDKLFFYGFFCDFERCGSAARFNNFQFFFGGKIFYEKEKIQLQTLIRSSRLSSAFYE